MWRKRAIVLGSAGLIIPGVLLLFPGVPTRVIPPRPAAPAVGPPPPPAAPLVLSPQSSIERRFTAGELHRYQIDLAKDAYLHLIVEQRGVDVAVTIRGPSGDLRCRVDSPTGSEGAENVALWAKVGGVYQVEVVALREAPDGTYRLHVAEHRVATAEDRRRAIAARLYSEAELLRREGNGDARRAAIPKYSQAIELWSELGARQAQAFALNYLGEMRWRVGQRATALAAYREALELLAELDEPSLLATVLSSSGAVHRALGEFEVAQRCYDQALMLFRQRGQGKEEAITLNNLGRLSSARGAMHEAQRWYGQALERWRELGERGLQASALTNLAGVYMATGQMTLALDHLTQARELLPRGEDPRTLADILNQMADVYTYAGQRSEALAHFDQALALYRGAADQRGEGFTLIGYGRLHLRVGEHHKARIAFESALRLFDQLEDRRGRAIALHDLGWLYETRGNAEQAHRHYRRSLPLARAVKYRGGMAETLFGLARVERRRGELEQAWIRVAEALDIVEGLRSGAERIDLRTSFFATKQDYYDLAVELAADLELRHPGRGHAARAFELSERSKARSLLDLLPEVSARDAADPSLLELERRLGRELNSASIELARQAADDPANDLRQRRVRALLADYQKVRAEIRRASPGALSGPRPLSLTEVQTRVLDADTLLLEYDLGREQSHLWAVTTSSMSRYGLPPQKVIEDLARETHELFSKSHRRVAHTPAKQAAARLSALLLDPVAEQLSQRRLVIVTDGALQYLPFGALPRPRKDPSSDRAGEPLLVDHEIIYAPSASVLALLRDELTARSPAPGSLAVLADPVFQQHDPRVRGPHGAESWLAAADQRPETAPPDDTRFGRLGFTRREADEILSLVPDSKTFRALDFAASKETVESGVLAGFRIVHFATHGLIHDQHPELSGIVLSLVDREGRPRDGFLRLHEVHTLDLRADLVVLSACKTALGPEIRGEGMVGLTQGFLQAGAARVLVSLWQIGDQATAELIQRFYRAMLIDRLPPAAALRESQLSMWRERRWSAPYHWAGFVLQGDWRSGPTQSEVLRVLESKPGRDHATGEASH